jgi:SAM-dependent methyltransferase
VGLNKLRNKVGHWDKVGRIGFKKSPPDILAEHKKKTHLRLLARWADLEGDSRILKTDLFEEASGPDQFLFDLGQRSNSIIGIDVSREIVAQAKRRASQHSVDSSKYLCCDVRYLPLKRDSIDLIVSDSTLDHFPSEEDISVALKELARTLRVNGTLILTMDNKHNLTYPPYALLRLWMKLGLAPYFIGRTLSLAALRRILEREGLSVEESTAIFHYPHPDGLVRWAERLLRKLSGGRLDSAIRRGLALLDRLEGKRTKYLTGRYIAVKAVKHEG